MDLTTNYMGLTLKNPLVPSASPLSRNIDTMRRLEDAGAGAIVLYSLFEEQATLESNLLDHYLNYFTEAFAEATDWYPEMRDYQTGPEEYVEHIRKAKEALDIPIIASLNGVSRGGWLSYAKDIEQAGADALELNVYYVATDPMVGSEDVEQKTVDILKTVRENVCIPVAVKLSPYYSATANLAQRLVDAGASALVLFNRFYQPDLDLGKMEVVPRLVLSTSEEMRLPLRWVAILYGRIPVDFAITTGVHTHEDAIKGLVAGAKVTMMASELLSNGPGRISEMLEGIRRWMDARGYESVSEMQGSMSQQRVDDPAAFERANYMAVLQSWYNDPAGQLFRDVLNREQVG
jgi:dihydroorotate dehydrogenase (fumarate)